MEYLILFLPLFASIISGFFGNFIGDKISQNNQFIGILDIFGFGVKIDV